MLEKLKEEIEVEADEYALKESTACDYGESKKHVYKGYFYGFKKGAEFGYKKANEWHYVKDEGTPIHEGHYLVCLRNKNRDIFDCQILFDKFVGWYSYDVRLVDVYAWKEIIPPEQKEGE